MTGRDGLPMHRDDMDRLLAAWFEDDAGGDAPVALVDAAIARSAVTPRRSSAMLLTQRWPSLIATLRLRFRPTQRQALVLIVLALVVALAAAAAYIGNHQRRPAPPFGPARNGLITFDADNDIVTSNLDGSGRHNITSDPAVESSPSFSPNGLLLTYFARPVAYGYQKASLIVANADGSDPRVIDNDVLSYLSKGNVAPASWSPDSTQLVYLHSESGSHGLFYGDLAIADFAAGTWRPLLPGVRAADPAWSPDGSRIVFREISDDLQSASLDFVAPNGTAPVQANAPPGDDSAYALPMFSPDGNWVVTAGNVFPHQVLVIPVDGGQARRLTRSTDDEFWPTFSNDGTRIAWEVGRLERDIDKFTVGSVWVANADGTDPHELNVDVKDLSGSPLYWSPDDALLFGYEGQGNAAGSGDVSDAIVMIPVDGRSPARMISASGTSVTGNWQRLAPCLVPVFC